MMTAEECRAKADALAEAAGLAVNYLAAPELVALAGQWRGLAWLADWQDAICLSTLAGAAPTRN